MEREREGERERGREGERERGREGERERGREREKDQRQRAGSKGPTTALTPQPFVCHMSSFSGEILASLSLYSLSALCVCVCACVRGVCGEKVLGRVRGRYSRVSVVYAMTTHSIAAFPHASCRMPQASSLKLECTLTRRLRQAPALADGSERRLGVAVTLAHRCLRLGFTLATSACGLKLLVHEALSCVQL